MSQYDFTPRQCVLIDRLKALTEQAANFPLPITEIWGGGSLFRLEENPNDADCIFIFDQPHRLIDWISQIRDLNATEVTRIAASELDPVDAEVIKWWYTIEVNPSGIGYQSFEHVLTKRLIAKSFPRISVVELAKSVFTTRMELSLIWTSGTNFDSSVLVANAAKHQAADHQHLLREFAEFRKANRLLKECIESPIDGYDTRLEEARDLAIGNPTKPVRPSKTTKPVHELRKMVKHQTKLYEALLEAAQVQTSDPCIIADKVLRRKTNRKKYTSLLLEAGVVKQCDLRLLIFCPYCGNDIFLFGRILKDYPRLIKSFDCPHLISWDWHDGEYNGEGCGILTVDEKWAEVLSALDRPKIKGLRTTGRHNLQAKSVFVKFPDLQPKMEWFDPELAYDEQGELTDAARRHYQPYIDTLMSL